MKRSLAGSTRESKPLFRHARAHATRQHTRTPAFLAMQTRSAVVESPHR